MKLNIQQLTSQVISTLVSSSAEIGVGLSADYASSQKLYIENGYHPDGLDITYQYKHFRSDELFKEFV